MVTAIGIDLFEHAITTPKHNNFIFTAWGPLDDNCNVSIVEHSSALYRVLLKKSLTHLIFNYNLVKIIITQI